MLLVAAQPSAQAQVVDARSAALESRLFPALEGVRRERLPADAKQALAARIARIDSCGQDPRCIVLRSIWTGEEISLIARTAEAALKNAVDPYAQPDDGVSAEVIRELTGLNSILQVYGLGMPSRNPEIDGPIFKVGASPFALRVSDAITISQATRAEGDLDPSVGLAIALLDVNDRTEAADFEPLETKYNAPALARARRTDWTKFKYTAILIPGNGPELLGETLSPRGKLRVHLAAERFADKVAPFIIVSGGAVHPRGTDVNEAVEMRRALIERYGIPEENIIIEPYARYTYTNLRNSVRRLHAIHAPLDRKALIITDVEHTKYVTGPEFKTRGLTTLGYLPGTVEATSSPTEAEFTPSRSALRSDPLDPLDP